MSGVRLHFIVEGQTEETFVNRILADHLSIFRIWADARCVTTSRKRGRVCRGGLANYAQAKNDIVMWSKQEPEAAFTTMFDYYALPSDFPGHEAAMKLAKPIDRIAAIEQALANDIAHPRFVPYIQLHEFEALLLADPGKFQQQYCEHEQPISELVEMAGKFESPELIDDGQDTAPSKRIIAAIPEYEGMKSSVGPLIAAGIGLPKLRESCPHFHAWLNKLEQLGTAPA
jgi:hypothetical protein